MSLPSWSSGWQKRPQGVATSADTAPTHTWTTTLPTGFIPCEQGVGIRVMVYGDTDGDDIDLEIYTVERQAGFNNPDFYLPRLFLGIDAILVGVGTAKGVATTGGNVPELLNDLEFMADTFPTPTVDAYGSRVLAAHNASADVYSPLSDKAGELLISHLGNAAGVIIVFNQMEQNFAGAIYELFRP